jgi:hypothetical protein
VHCTWDTRPEWSLFGVCQKGEGKNQVRPKWFQLLVNVTHAQVFDFHVIVHAVVRSTCGERGS